MRISSRLTKLIGGALIVAGLTLYAVIYCTLPPSTTTPRFPFQAPHPPIAFELPPAVPTAPTHASNFRDNLEKATNKLYANIGGATRFVCTTTAIQRTATGYIFLTARHCVAIESATDFYIVIDPKSDTPFIRATVLLAGGQDTDAALISINTPINIPVIPLGDERLIGTASRVEYFGYPQELGKLYFEGYVSQVKIGPPTYADPQWEGDLGLTIPVAPGSSGSALVDPNQEAIVGVVTGATVSRFGGAILTMATPASRVRVLVTDYKTGHVRHIQDDSWIRKFFGQQ